MDKLKIIDNNKLIAKFMGGWYKDGYTYINHLSALCYKSDCLSYHSSWDWLMPVVEKIERIKTQYTRRRLNYSSIMRYRYKVNIRCDRCWIDDYTGYNWTVKLIVSNEEKTKIESVYKTVIEFIEWYDTQH